MSDPLRTDAESSEPTRSPVRPLWIFGLVLTLASAAGSLWSQYQWVANSNGYSGPTTPPNFAAAQLITSITPSTLTGGIVCCGLALAMTAYQRIRAADPAPAPMAQHPPSATSPPALGDPTMPPPATPAPASIDIDAFRRPR